MWKRFCEISFICVVLFHLHKSALILYNRSQHFQHLATATTHHSSKNRVKLPYVNTTLPKICWFLFIIKILKWFLTLGDSQRLFLYNKYYTVLVKCQPGYLCTQIWADKQQEHWTEPGCLQCCVCLFLGSNMSQEWTVSWCWFDVLPYTCSSMGDLICNATVDAD